ncbi:MAG: hypothetical protein II937_09395 [Bacteroidales bacterium]|nr:hypothetical protein [Bacteroidales bacterium]MBQ5402964.1 hypothetical protein [Bacteroidales bacterium]
MNNILPTTFNVLYVFAGMVLLEFIIFLIMSAKKKLNVIRIFFAVLSGNAFTTILNLFVPEGSSTFGYLTWFIIAFLMAIAAEWLIYIAYFNDRENRLSKTGFLWISIVCNLVTFSILYLLKQYSLL